MLANKSMLQRIHIIGGPGSGKTYAARRLSHRLGTPAYDLDDLLWDSAAQNYGVRAPEVVRDARLVAIIEEEVWIIEGVYYRWLKPSFERADIIFVMCPNVYLRDWRILKRFASRKFGIMATKRESLLDFYRLIQWNHKYDVDNLKRAMDFIRELEHKVVTCRSADDLLSRVAELTPKDVEAFSRLCGDAAHVKRLDDNLQLSQENYAMIEQRYLDLLRELSTNESPHSNRSLFEHLKGTYELLAKWDNPNDVCIGGLFHSIYGTQYYKVPSANLSDRKHIADVIGSAAEELAFLFCTTDRVGFFREADKTSPVLIDTTSKKSVPVSAETMLRYV